MIPAQTTPLSKSIRTLEGILVVAADVVVGAAAAVDSSQVSPKLAAILVAAQHIGLLVQRGVIKASAARAVQAVVDSPDPLDELLKEAVAATEVPATAAKPDIAPGS